MAGFISQPIASLNGTMVVPGDKSISHRSLILASQAKGTSHIRGLLEGEDVLATANALRMLGVDIQKQDDVWVVQGVGVGQLQATSKTLDMGNAGTGVRLMMGLLASYPFASRFTGDKSLCARPMGRVLRPLESIGMRVVEQQEGRLPITIEGTEQALAKTHQMEVASAQVKTAILLAGLNIDGPTTIIEPIPTRDHSERMLRSFGAKLTQTQNEQGEMIITLEGKATLHAKDIDVPADPSSASFAIVAALICPGSKIQLNNVGMNPGRIGLIDTLLEMGADIAIDNMRDVAGEPVADLSVRYSPLRGVDVPASRAPSMIDEYPILSVAASYASGSTYMHGLEELKVKESDRLAAIANGLSVCGVPYDLGEDSLVVHGGSVPGGATVQTHMDHRIAMSFLIMGLQSNQGVVVDDIEMIATSFPGFVEQMNQLGAKIEPWQG